MVPKKGYMTVTATVCPACNGIGRLAKHADGTICMVGVRHESKETP